MADEKESVGKRFAKQQACIATGVIVGTVAAGPIGGLVGGGVGVVADRVINGPAPTEPKK